VRGGMRARLMPSASTIRLPESEFDVAIREAKAREGSRAG